MNRIDERAMKKNITKQDVALYAGVSHMTVTRVLQKSPNVSSATRKKVLHACKTLGYRPNILASSLREQRSRTIGIIIPTFEHAFFARFLRHIETDCRNRGYHAVAIQGRREPSSPPPSIAWEDIEFLLMRRVDGIIVAFSIPEKLEQKLFHEHLPTVFFDSPPHDKKKFSYVALKDYEAGYTLTSWLLSLGHRNIAFLSGSLISPVNEGRLRGYRAAIKAHGIPYNPNLVPKGELSLEGGKQNTEFLLAKKEPFTALIGANDYLAIGAIATLHAKGIKVPEDISVAGITGDPIGEFVAPPLTTMVQPVEPMAHAVTELLFARIQNSSILPESRLFSASFLPRKSVRPIRRSQIQTLSR